MPPFPSTTRRALLAGAGALAAAAGCRWPAAAAEPPVAGPAWRGFVSRFIAADGRVVDIGNGGISHSEGQGYGMVLAVAAGDRAVFDRLWAWTRRTLAVRDDGLMAWKWEEGKGIPDRNNASDGDVLIAWALLTGAERWNDAELRAAALALLGAVRDRVVTRLADMTLLLPGAAGFRRDTGIVVNPSYLVLPAFRAFAAADPAGPWEELIRSGLVLLAKARFGRWQLPPDWAAVAEDGTVSLPDGFTKQFGYDAIRVPLYLAWAGYRDPYYFRPYSAFAAQFGERPIPATVSLPGGTTAQVGASRGMLAVHRLAARLANAGNTVAVPAAAGEDGYYSTVLGLLTGLAERSLGSTP
ncbi:glycosyl hydrolase family 8 [Azospirillum sp. ST 5-10]|uniref:glycosyl hydrolase family 8 n=1 Tax=unclassified Azospirillum TaxID=2630922 RepID=UPI003F49F483